MSDDKTFEFGYTGGPDVVSGGQPATELTELAKLRTKIRKRVQRPEFYLAIPEREGVELKISPNFTSEQLEKWRERAGAGTKRGFNTTLFAAIVVAQTTKGLFNDGVEVLSESGHPLTFASPEVLDMLDTTTPVPDGVRLMFGVDPHVEAAAAVILDRAGYSDTVEAAEDPTTKS